MWPRPGAPRGAAAAPGRAAEPRHDTPAPEDPAARRAPAVAGRTRGRGCRAGRQPRPGHRPGTGHPRPRRVRPVRHWDILVAPTTTLAWTILLARAAAVSPTAAPRSRTLPSCIP